MKKDRSILTDQQSEIFKRENLSEKKNKKSTFDRFFLTGLDNGGRDFEISSHQSTDF